MISPSLDKPWRSEQDLAAVMTLTFVESETKVSSPDPLIGFICEEWVIGTSSFRGDNFVLTVSSIREDKTES